MTGDGQAPEVPAVGVSGNLQEFLTLPEEFYNVDDFFGTYVNELTNRSKRENTADEAMVNGNNKRQMVGSRGNGGGGIPAVPATSGQFGASADGNLHIDMDAAIMDFGVGMDAQEGDGDKIEKMNARGGKSGKQQAANKIAQQRYRERKKQKYVEMEKAVKNMEQQLANLQALNKRNSMLEEMNSALQAQVVTKERELERLKAALDAQAEASLFHSGEHGGSSGNLGSLKSEGHALPMLQEKKPQAGNSISCDILPRDLTGIDFQTGFSDQIVALKTFLEKHNLLEDEMSLKDELLAELATLVGRSCQLCQAAIRAEGVKVLDLISCDSKSKSRIGSENAEVWIKALSAMKMTHDQEQDLLLLRQSHLDKMRDIYEERQRLNLDAMAMMIPHTSKVPEEDSTLEGRMHTMSSGTYLPLARNNAELGAILDKIKDNLRREQRSVMDLNCCTISRILTPLQAARYMVTVYPLHCDALALSNAVAKNAGKSGDSTTSHNNASCGNSGQTIPQTCGASGCC
eukprot:jgi/Picsp_1/3826/NSC_01338-R1_expressed protein [Chlorella variabilis]